MFSVAWEWKAGMRGVPIVEVLLFLVAEAFVLS